MSGPIVRKYGFPNFEKIFGERELQHGVEEPETNPEEPKPSAPEQSADSQGERSKSGAKKGEKKP
jgi:hypothetical protein